MAAADEGGVGRHPLTRFCIRAIQDCDKDSELTSEEIHDLERLLDLLGGGLASLGKGAANLYEFYRNVEDYERDYLTPTELGFCAGTLLFYGGILTGFYKMYMFLSSEEDRILGEIRTRRKRRGNNSSGNVNNGSNDNGGSGSNDNGNGGNKEDDH